MSRLASRTALGTGAASGIGRAVATRFAREGARVVIADRDAEAAVSAADDIVAELGAEARPLTVDISSEPSVPAGFAELVGAGWCPAVVVAPAGGPRCAPGATGCTCRRPGHGRASPPRGPGARAGRRQASG